MVRDEPLALILAPTGRDAEVAVAILHEVGLPATTCARPAVDAHSLERAGCAVVTEEALLSSDRRHLSGMDKKAATLGRFSVCSAYIPGGSPDARLPEMPERDSSGAPLPSSGFGQRGQIYNLGCAHSEKWKHIEESRLF